jgi:hypothetical protein
MKLRYLAVAALVGALSVVLVTVAIGAKKSPAPKPKSKTFFAVLLGKKEVTAAGKKRAGDLGARGGATAVIDGDQFCFGIVVKNLSSNATGSNTPMAAHVHKGRRNVAGPIRITLTPPSSGDPGASSGCVTVNEPALLAAIKRNPHKYYINVHNGAFPEGAVRGQLSGKRN